jgi:glycosyltransferase involved in cell wall biosynthesis
MLKYISLCIPYYNTFDLTKKTIDILIKSKFINEIIISDDCSNVPFVYNHAKVKIYRNLKNLGALKNKFKTVQYARNKWVYLLDSDNFIDLKMFKKLYKILKKNKFKNDYFYSPSRLILQNIDLDKKLNNKIINYNFKDRVIDFKLVKQYLGKVKYFNWFLNTGNFFINKNKYVECANKMFSDKKLKQVEADAMVFSYYWLKSGKKIEILDNFYYFHRLSKSSYSHHKNNRKSLDLYTRLFMVSDEIKISFFKRIIKIFI